MKKLFFILILILTLTNCAATNWYSYETDKVLINNKWNDSSSYTAHYGPSIWVHVVDYSNPNTYIRDIMLIGETSRPIIFRNDIKIKSKNKIYIIKKENLTIFQSSPGEKYHSYIDLYDLGIKINSDFILELGTINENGKDTYVPPLYYRKFLSRYKSNWIIEGFNESLYSGWADKYKGK